MQSLNLFTRAFKPFRTQTLQTLLIVVAIALGVSVVAAVAALLEVGTQSQAALEKALFTRELSLQAKEDDDGAFYAGGAEPTPVREVGPVDAQPVTFSVGDLGRAKGAAPSVDYAYTDAPIEVATARSDAYAYGSAVTEAYLDAAKIQVQAGSLPSESDFRDARRVALVSERLIKQRGLAAEPIGHELSLSASEPPYRIIGVLKGAETAEFQPDVLVPFDSANQEPAELKFAVREGAKLDQARAELTAFASRTWGERVSVSAFGGFEAFKRQERVLFMFIAAFASVGLVVAAMNVMNLMMARVLGRTRAIGVSRSLGATRARVGVQYLTESLVLGLSGGVLGLGAGYGLLAAFRTYLRRSSPEDLTAISFSPAAMGIGLALALGVSLLFGSYPAFLASRVRMVEALRDL